MSGLAANLASALAARLAAVTPPRVVVTAVGSAVLVAVDEGSPSMMEIGGIIEEQRDMLDSIRIAAFAVLSRTQDHIVHTMKEQWPASAAGGSVLPFPDATIEGERLTLSYGDKAAPTLVLDPISIDELAE